MTFDFLDRRSAERFAELLDETGGGRPHHNRGQADDELAELVAIGHSLSATRPGVRVDPEFRQGLRAMLVATAERDGIGATATEAETETGGHAAAGRARRGLLGRGTGRRIRARGAIVIGVAAGALAVSGISAASENASPGDALYGVKRSTERAQLAMAGSDITRGQLSLDFARTRLTEAAALDGADGAFSAVLADMDADTRQGVRLLTTSAVTRTDTAPLTTVDGFVVGQRRTFEPMLETLSADNRARARESMALLDQVQERTGNLRAGLACGTVRQVGTDPLGPVLRDCLTGATGTESADDVPQGHGEKAATRPDRTRPDDAPGDPERTGPAVAPGRTGDTTAPDSADPSEPGEPDVNPATGEPTPSGSTPAEPSAEEPRKGLLGGLLDSIFG